MKGWLLVFSLLLLLGCNTHRLPPNFNVLNYDTLLHKNIDGWWYKGKPFSGYMIQEERNHFIVYKLPIINGKENGLALAWYNTGEKLLQRFYVDGKREGAFTQWWPNGKIRYLFNYKNDVYNGKQLVFFPDGKVRQESNFIMGDEEGLQRIWNQDGRLISNYTIKNKHLYGIIKVRSCIPTQH